MTLRLISSLMVLSILTNSMVAELVTVAGREFRVPEGFQLQRAVQPGLTLRPIVIDFDDRGRLYVAESSGTNDNVQKQLADRPHSVLRLSDSDNDGTFDTKTVFADRMMFPEGVLWHNGSVYVAAPPHIWKLTDHDDDGVAEERSVWFDGETLTGCANDLHGPYLGLDGWIYWCKGAFAEQTYDRPGRGPLVTRAAHIFRRRPEGGPIESVMTGGMDNPVEVAFTNTGERIFTTTFFQHPAGGKRDGLVHAIYGGVYGKQHGVLDGHPRTGELMPVMTHLGAAAPSGLAMLRSDTLGFKNQLLTACFNLHSVTRHKLVKDGASYITEDTDLVSSDDLDFHPTDVAEDADGSVLIVDTGGWYKLCCPTSQLHKPDVLGTIYRLTRLKGPEPNDARGLAIDWPALPARGVVDYLSDARPAVRRRAQAELELRGASAISALKSSLDNRPEPSARLEILWTACRINHPDARSLVRRLSLDPTAEVRQAAAHAISVWRDPQAKEELRRAIADESAAVRRAAAEAIGRVGDTALVPDLLSALSVSPDRVLEHSLIYALIEIGNAGLLRPALASESVTVRRAAILVLHGMDTDQLQREQLVELLRDADRSVRRTAVEVARAYPQWGAAYVDAYEHIAPHDIDRAIATDLARLSDIPAVRPLIRTLLLSEVTPTAAKRAIIQGLPLQGKNSEHWRDILENVLVRADGPRLAEAIVASLRPGDALAQSLGPRLVEVASTPAVKLQAAGLLQSASDELVRFAVNRLHTAESGTERGLAASALARWELSPSQLAMLVPAMATVGPLEISRALDCFEKASQVDLGRKLFQSLIENPATAVIVPQRLLRVADQFGPEIRALATRLSRSVHGTYEDQLTYLEEILGTLPAGDVRRGQKVFHGAKAACFSCHAVGYRGGTLGPDLSRIGRIRSRRDLLESIVFPSMSFVRSYEPTVILTTDGAQISGVVQDESPSGMTLSINATERRLVEADEIEQRLPGTVSVMPAGLEKQISNQQLADLLAFLESRK